MAISHCCNARSSIQFVFRAHLCCVFAALFAAARFFAASFFPSNISHFCSSMVWQFVCTGSWCRVSAARNFWCLVCAAVQFTFTFHSKIWMMCIYLLCLQSLVDTLCVFLVSILSKPISPISFLSRQNSFAKHFSPDRRTLSLELTNMWAASNCVNGGLCKGTRIIMVWPTVAHYHCLVAHRREQGHLLKLVVCFADVGYVSVAFIF